MGGEVEKKLHAIMICVPYQGHLNPYVNLALKLASKGIIVTFVHLEALYRKLLGAANHSDKETRVDFFAGARESGLDIRFTTMNDHKPLEFDRDANFEEYWETMIRDFAPVVDEFVGKLVNSNPDLLHFLVADTVYNWPAEITEKHKLVYVSLWTQPALVYSLGYHWDFLEQNGHFPCKDDAEEEIKYVPGVESINTRDLMPFLKESLKDNVLSWGSRLYFENGKKADFVLQNTVEELELETLSALNKYLPNYAIGPINFSKNLPLVTRSFWSQSDCTGWLDSKPPGSVLYVSFGSFVQANKHLIEEVAYGLALSGVNFLWVIREGILGDGNTEVLPRGFKEEVKDRGMTVGWCDQIKVLSHPAVAGFWTHNGWNSTVESMWSGVPMICLPFQFDQPCNRKLVVDDWEIGVNLGDGGGSLDRGHVAETIKNFMSVGVLEKLRKNAGRVKEIMHNAMESDGSSERNFARFLKDLEGKVRATKRWAGLRGSDVVAHIGDIHGGLRS